ncbi:hypothetical protein GCM10007935_04900 [Hydrogenophaga electricum]|uniref:Uncharacterized protein n=1 Tax=Hydrogenophaga electricum TaxID=1230953 RepID=A0ABQ6C4B2_9BURK|nr:hypothetical protein GCM10007935_04900 [Hydrogenophaga electricum]
MAGAFWRKAVQAYTLPPPYRRQLPSPTSQQIDQSGDEYAVAFGQCIQQVVGLRDVSALFVGIRRLQVYAPSASLADAPRVLSLLLRDPSGRIDGTSFRKQLGPSDFGEITFDTFDVEAFDVDALPSCVPSSNSC